MYEKKSCVILVEAAALDGVNAVLDAMGWGYPALTVALYDHPNANEQSVPTHWTTHDNLFPEQIAELQRLQAGALPAISGEWGENGVIGANDAVAACDGARMLVLSASGAITGEEHLKGILLGKSLYLYPAPAL